MRRFFTMQSRRTRFSRRLPHVAAEVQSLEVRALPTGTVTAVLSNGNLTIGGDNLDNSILIAVSSTGISLSGLPDSGATTFTTVKFGTTTNSAGEAVPILTDSVTLKSLTILMRGGNDNVRLSVGDLGTTNASITGKLRINLGTGNDHGVVIVNNGTLIIGGNLEGDLDNGNDCLLVGTSDLLTGGSSVPTTLPIQIGGNVIVMGRLGDDLIALAGAEVQKGVNIDSGDQNDSVSLTGDTIHGNLSVNGNRGSNDLLLQSVTVFGTTAIRGGGGNGADRVRVNDFTAKKNVAVYLYAGADQLSIGTVTLDAGVQVTLDGGTGSDAVMSDTTLDDLPVKVRGFEDLAATIDVDAITSSILGLMFGCLDATAPPT